MVNVSRTSLFSRVLWVVVLSKATEVDSFCSHFASTSVKPIATRQKRNSPSPSWHGNDKNSVVLLKALPVQTAASSLSSSSTFLVRIVFLRALALVHFVAFWVAYRQNKALIGDNGITPARHVLNQAEQRGKRKQQRRLNWRREQQQQQTKKSFFSGPLNLDQFLWTILFKNPVARKLAGTIDRFPLLLRLREILWDRSDGRDRPLPTLLWLAKDRQRLDPALDRIAMAGLALSLFIFVLGAANVPIMLALWLCQRSLMAVGGVFYGYGWEPQLAELGFHALFLVPLFSLQRIPSFPIPSLVAWMVRWHLFRIMLGAGLIKFRSGDKKWRDLTAMEYFYETQPVPNPLTRYFHWMPKAWHKFEVVANHFVEVVAPWLLILPGLPVPLRRVGGLFQIIFQSVLISSGNLSFLNWLTMVPAILSLDDAFLSGIFGAETCRAAATAATMHSSLSTSRRLVSVLFFVAMAQLSVPVVRNLCSKKQIMNSSFDPLRLVNTYGAFGVVSERREEFIVKASRDAIEWREYDFQVKPGDIHRSPKFISPYHHRIDWQIWIASSGRLIQRSPWLYSFLLKLLEQDRNVMKLLGTDPFQDSPEPPKYIRIERYLYKFHKKQKGEQSPPYWDRIRVDRVYPKQGFATVESLKKEITFSLPCD